MPGQEEIMEENRRRPGSIRLHPKHGLNPTLVACWLCGSETGEIALLGAACKEEAPRHMTVNHSICGKCQGMLDEGRIALIEAVRPRPAYEGGDPEPKRTGGLAFIKEEAAKRIFNIPLGGSKIVYVEPGVLEKLKNMSE
jgi:hypothetical protein